MQKRPNIRDNLSYMHPNETVLTEFAAQRFNLLLSQKAALTPVQKVVMGALSNILFPVLDKGPVEYNEDRAVEFRHLLRHYTEEAPINLKTIKATELRKILDEFHHITSNGASNANRTSLMQNMVGDYSIKRLLNRVKGYRESPSFYTELCQEDSILIKHQSINLRACGFPEKAEICDKHNSRYLLLESVISGALEQLPEKEIIATITQPNGISRVLSKMKFPTNLDNLTELKERFGKIKPVYSSAADIFAEMGQMRDVLPKDLPEASEKSHQRANYLIVNKSPHRVNLILGNNVWHPFILCTYTPS